MPSARESVSLSIAYLASAMVVVALCIMVHAHFTNTFVLCVPATATADDATSLLFLGGTVLVLLKLLDPYSRSR